MNGCVRKPPAPNQTLTLTPLYPLPYSPPLWRKESSAVQRNAMPQTAFPRCRKCVQRSLRCAITKRRSARTHYIRVVVVAVVLLRYGPCASAAQVIQGCVVSGVGRRCFGYSGGENIAIRVIRRFLQYGLAYAS